MNLIKNFLKVNPALRCEMDGLKKQQYIELTRATRRTGGTDQVYISYLEKYTPNLVNLFLIGKSILLNSGTGGVENKKAILGGWLYAF